jgi:hypothetical protein
VPRQDGRFHDSERSKPFLIWVALTGRTMPVSRKLPDSRRIKCRSHPNCRLGQVTGFSASPGARVNVCTDLLVTEGDLPVDSDLSMHLACDGGGRWETGCRWPTSGKLRWSLWCCLPAVLAAASPCSGDARGAAGARSPASTRREVEQMF